MDDAIRFFRGEFTKAHVDPEKFDKEYTYGIRYNYGKEGKKVNWAPWNCMRVITQSVGAGECNGCPYRHHDPDILRGHLVQSGKKIHQGPRQDFDIMGGIFKLFLDSNVC